MIEEQNQEIKMLSDWVSTLMFDDIKTLKKDIKEFREDIQTHNDKIQNKPIKDSLINFFLNEFEAIFNKIEALPNDFAAKIGELPDRFVQDPLRYTYNNRNSEPSISELVKLTSLDRASLEDFYSKNCQPDLSNALPDDYWGLEEEDKQAFVSCFSQLKEINCIAGLKVFLPNNSEEATAFINKIDPTFLGKLKACTTFADFSSCLHDFFTCDNFFAMTRHYVDKVNNIDNEPSLKALINFLSTFIRGNTANLPFYANIKDYSETNPESESRDPIKFFLIYILKDSSCKHSNFEVTKKSADIQRYIAGVLKRLNNNFQHDFYDDDMSFPEEKIKGFAQNLRHAIRNKLVSARYVLNDLTKEALLLDAAENFLTLKNLWSILPDDIKNAVLSSDAFQPSKGSFLGESIGYLRDLLDSPQKNEGPKIICAKLQEFSNKYPLETKAPSSPVAVEPTPSINNNHTEATSNSHNKETDTASSIPPVSARQVPFSSASKQTHDVKKDDIASLSLNNSNKGTNNVISAPLTPPVSARQIPLSPFEQDYGVKESDIASLSPQEISQKFTTEIKNSEGNTEKKNKLLKLQEIVNDIIACQNEQPLFSNPGINKKITFLRELHARSPHALIKSIIEKNKIKMFVAWNMGNDQNVQSLGDAFDAIIPDFTKKLENCTNFIDLSKLLEKLFKSENFFILLNRYGQMYTAAANWPLIARGDAIINFLVDRLQKGNSCLWQYITWNNIPQANDHISSQYFRDFLRYTLNSTIEKQQKKNPAEEQAPYKEEVLRNFFDDDPHYQYYKQYQDVYTGKIISWAAEQVKVFLTAYLRGTKPLDLMKAVHHLSWYCLLTYPQAFEDPTFELPSQKTIEDIMLKGKISVLITSDMPATHIVSAICSDLIFNNSKESSLNDFQKFKQTPTSSPDAEEKIKALEEKNATLENQLNQQEEQLNEQKAKTQKLEATNDSLKTTLAKQEIELQETSKKIQEERTRLQKDLEFLLKEKEKSDQQLDMLKKNIGQLESDQREAKGNLEALSKRYHERGGQLEQSQSEVAQLKEKNASLEESTLVKALQDSNLNLKKARQEQQKYEEEIKAQKIAIDAINRAGDEVGALVDTALKEIKELVEKNSSLESQLSFEKTDTKRLQAENGTLREELTTRAETIRQLKKDEKNPLQSGSIANANREKEQAVLDKLQEIADSTKEYAKQRLLEYHKPKGLSFFSRLRSLHLHRTFSKAQVTEIQEDIQNRENPFDLLYCLDYHIKFVERIKGSDENGNPRYSALRKRLLEIRNKIVKELEDNNLGVIVDVYKKIKPIVDKWPKIGNPTATRREKSAKRIAEKEEDIAQLNNAFHYLIHGQPNKDSASLDATSKSEIYQAISPLRQQLVNPVQAAFSQL